MPYLCSVLLNPLRSGAQRLMENPQRMHAAVEGCLPPARSGRLLWRLEVERTVAELLVLAPDRPTLEHLVEQAGWEGNEQGAPRVADMETLLRQVGVGRRFAFRARLNPAYVTANIQNASGAQQRILAEPRRKPLVGHRTAAHQLRWFTDRAAGGGNQWGFTVGASPDEANVTIVQREQLRFSRGRGTAPVTLQTATFEGALQITDSDLFRRSLVEGIGRGKAYGCGLLTLAPLRSGHVVEG